MITRLLCFLAFAAITLPGYAQSAKPDTAFLTSARTYQKDLYEKFIRGQSRLYNGSEHRDYHSRNEEHPYFGVDDWGYGVLVYDDQVYRNVPMFYDLSRDRVISEHVLNGAKIELVTEKISLFTLSDHTFVRLYRDEKKIISTGFYDMLYNGGSKVYVRREKLLQEKVESNDIIAQFEIRNRIYILKDGKYFPVKKKKSVLEVFADQKQELKAFLKQNKITYKADREHAVVQLAQYYDAQPK